MWGDSMDGIHNRMQFSVDAARLAQAVTSRGDVTLKRIVHGRRLGNCKKIPASILAQRREADDCGRLQTAHIEAVSKRTRWLAGCALISCFTLSQVILPDSGLAAEMALGGSTLTALKEFLVGKLLQVRGLTEQQDSCPVYQCRTMWSLWALQVHLFLFVLLWPSRWLAQFMLYLHDQSEDSEIPAPSFFPCRYLCFLPSHFQLPVAFSLALSK
jgi:hypothetical protein